MPLSRAEVEHVARLAHIALDRSEIEVLTEQLSSVVDHVAVLQRLNTSGVEPTAHVANVQNVMRDDQVQPSWPPQAIVANAPRSSGNLIEVQAVLD
ncbi:MAG: Asp-tRNA(Asn)/Glu-tRNA(Gln) amidotransferase subunit GatC [Chloroflexota bacterium]